MDRSVLTNARDSIAYFIIHLHLQEFMSADIRFPDLGREDKNVERLRSNFCVKA